MRAGAGSGSLSGMTRLVLILTLAAATFAASSTAAVAPGKLKGSGAARGVVAIATAQATVKSPRALYGRATGKVETAQFIVSCSRGFNVSARTLERERAGTWKLPMPVRPDTCMVTASAGGSGAIRVEIRAS